MNKDPIYWTLYSKRSQTCLSNVTMFPDGHFEDEND